MTFNPDAPYQFSQVPDLDALIGLELVKGATTLTQTGFNADVDTSPEDIWPIGGDYVFPNDSGEAMEIVSSDPADTTQTYRVIGLDSEGEWKIEFIETLNGLTAVPLANNFSRINLINNCSSTPTVGDITVRPAGGGDTYAIAPAINQQSNQLIFSVPKNTKARLNALTGTMEKSIGSDASVALGVQIRVDGGPFRTVFGFGAQRSGSSSPFFHIPAPQTFGGIGFITDIKMRAEASDPNIRISGFFNVTMFDNVKPGT